MKYDNLDSLQVFQLSEQLADAVWNVVLCWDQFARQTIGNQIVRSADSIGANLAEGIGRWSYKDNRRFVRTARGSLYETRFWLRRARQRNLLDKEQVRTIGLIFKELAPKLNNYIQALDRSVTTTESLNRTTRSRSNK